MYQDADPALFGRTSNREEVMTVDFDTFLLIDTKELTRPVTTAILVQKGIKEVLYQVTAEIGKVELGDVVITRNENSAVFFLEYKKYGLEFSFSLDTASDAILEVVRDAYSHDEEWQKRLVNRYEENFVVTIHSAEQITPSFASNSDFTNAMVMASIIGDSSQWLWGIRDCYGLLDALEVLGRFGMLQTLIEFQKLKDQMNEMSEMVVRSEKKADGNTVISVGYLDENGSFVEIGSGGGGDSDGEE